MASAPSQLATFIAKYSPEVQRVFRRTRSKMLARLPGAIELVYDNYNALVIGYGPTERPSEALFSIVANPRHVTLCFLTGAKLADPGGILQGEGNVVRHVRLTDITVLDLPEVRALMTQAIGTAGAPMDDKRRHKLVIRSISKKQRPRRPAQS
jgi:hypothetical protein